MNWLIQQLQERPDAPGLYYGNRMWTFAEIGQEVQERMRYFSGCIPTTAVRIAVMSQNSQELYFTMLALWSLGKEIVCLNIHLQPRELEYQLTDAQVSFVLASEKCRTALQKVQNIKMIPLEQPTDYLEKGYLQFSDMSDEAVATIMYTSGTTGKPKGVIQRFKNHRASAEAAAINLGLSSADCWLCAVPLFHVSGLSIICRHLLYGCSIKLYEHFDAEMVTADLVRGHGSIMSVVPLMLEKLLAEFPDSGYHQKFRLFLLGGGPVSTAMLQECRHYGIEAIQSYGMTETCSQVISLNSKDSLKHIGAVGRPLEGVQIKIVDREYQTVSADTIGEIWLKGPSVISGYLNDAEWHHEKWTLDNWFRTGDMGYLDRHGYLYVVSRLSELIISGGENIYPVEVEHVLEMMPTIKTVAVIGEPDKMWGHVPVVYIVGTATQDEINTFLEGKLAKYKRPKKIYYCRVLPRTASGKLAKHRLLTAEREDFLWR
ncbi:o-succinylbenzoate--CoA ligase [Vagococcus vulneris]|uniref:2-succinylbenzoate--CoA ligase n=1 Tax=Vagococcus vulneris TaxID=1977869 RepID=A0A429ZYA6_9ENTE|nr:o-succinylbenzoate--CoA ligase [Vagococcus vulneris]RST98919.1 o-succinylbenzoate--CoA ligase [Vagococcus vulneris]